MSDWIADGTLCYGEALDSLAVKAGLDPVAVQGSVARYNDLCQLGADADFEKDGRFLRPLTKPPYYLLRVAPQALVATFCGLRIDDRAQVLDRASRPLPGLYAAGEAAGGVVGEVYAGHGNAVTSGLVFGRVAGANAATYALRT